MPSFELLDINARRNFWNKVSIGDGCWEWIAAKAPFGHGQFWIKKRQTMVETSRVAWWLKKGEIPDTICVLHHCDNPACVRLSHLYLGTKRDNALDRSARGRHWIQRRPEEAIAHLRKIAPLGPKGWKC